MNKYQEALIYFCNGCHHEYEEGNYGQCKRAEGRCGHYKSLKEACDKADKYDEINRVYLKNEVMESADINAERLQQLYEDIHLKKSKKEWEQLGYKWFEDDYKIRLITTVNDFVKEIYLDKVDRKYCCFDGGTGEEYDSITIQEHQLLTKTFKALGWL